ncbi:hypothetical protein vseg_006704 [Gypsophila vaccaria]
MESSSSSNIPLEDNDKLTSDLNEAPETDPDLLSDQSSKGELRKVEPEWLGRFVQMTFFDPCSEHAVWRNEMNKYCIDCDKSLCQHCISTEAHKDHGLLKLYRHVYKEVTPVDVIGQHIDCSQIQTYRCNKQMVIALTPLPHTGSKTFKDEELCRTCKRKLYVYNEYSYCSISCKVEAFIKKEFDDSPPFFAIKLEQANTAVDQPVQNAEQESEQNELTGDQLVDQEQEPSMTNLDLLAEAAAQEYENNVRKRKREESPHCEPSM